MGRRNVLGVTIMVILALASLPAGAASVGPAARDRVGAAAAKPFFDSRVGASRAAAVGSTAERSARRELRQDLGRQTSIQVDPLTETARSVQRLNGTLTGPAAGDRADGAMRWVKQNRTALGLTAGDVSTLTLSDRSVDKGSGFAFLRYRQYFRGIPTFDGGLRVNLDRGGRILNVTGAPISGLSVPSASPKLSAANALRALQSDVGVRRAIDVTSGPAGVRQMTRFTRGDFARLVLFDGPDGTVLAWHVVYRASSLALYDAVVDAASGRILFRQNLTKFDSDQTVFPDYPGAERDLNATKAAHNAKIPVNFETKGWLTDPAVTTNLSGPNAHVYTDRNDDNIAQGAEEVTRANAAANFNDTFTHTFQKPGTNACDFTANPPPPDLPADWPPPLGQKADCSWDPAAPATRDVNREQSGVQAFYFVNEYHDHLESTPIGFTDDNFEGDDPVQVNADDGMDTVQPVTGTMPDDDHVNNANMSTPPDGESPLMQMYLFRFDPDAVFGFRNIDGDDDAGTVYHEYTHGLSNRLITHADGSGALSSPHAGAMGEAWSDWYALDLLRRRGLELDAADARDVDIGMYTDATFTATRFEPIDCQPVVDDNNPRCPGGLNPDETGTGGFTFGDFGHVAGAPEVHSDGEIWAQTLWDLRRALVAQLGEIGGSNAAEQLITQGMRLSPPEPSFLDMRNAILAADTGLGNAHHALIWQVFAGRGMGYLASVQGSSDVSPVQDFHLPPNVLPSGTMTASPKTVKPGQNVTFTATFTDPDSKITGYGWDFDGNGTVDRTTAGGTTTFAYTRGGNFNARVLANDFRGGAGSATQKVHVTSRPKLGTLPKRGTNGRAKFKVTCELRCKVTAKLTLSKKLAKQLGLKNKRTVGSLKRTIAAGSSKRLTIKLTSKAKRALKNHGRSRVKATLTVTARYSDGRSRTAHRSITIKL